MTRENNGLGNRLHFISREWSLFSVVQLRGLSTQVIRHLWPVSAKVKAGTDPKQRGFGHGVPIEGGGHWAHSLAWGRLRDLSLLR